MGLAGSAGAHEGFSPLSGRRGGGRRVTEIAAGGRQRGHGGLYRSGGGVDHKMYALSQPFKSKRTAEAVYSLADWLVYQTIGTGKQLSELNALKKFLSFFGTGL